jgi:hypothetical protein
MFTGDLLALSNRDFIDAGGTSVMIADGSSGGRP